MTYIADTLRWYARFAPAVRPMLVTKSGQTQTAADERLHSGFSGEFKSHYWKSVHEHSMTTPICDNSNPSPSIPLCVDLDGSLIFGDTLVESTLLLLKRNPFYLILIPQWILSGRAAFKRQISKRSPLVCERLAVNPFVMDYLQREKRNGRELILVTAADSLIAEQIASHFGLFSEIIASDGELNLKGKNKSDELVRRFGSKKFDYIGNDQNDFAVWQHANIPLATNISSRLASRFTETFPNGILLSVKAPGFASSKAPAK